MGAAGQGVLDFWARLCYNVHGSNLPPGAAGEPERMFPLRIDILGVGFDNLTPEETVQAALDLMGEGGFHYAVTPNPEFILAARKNPAFSAALNGANLSMPDGIGVVYAAKILGRPLKGRVPGIDFADQLMDRLAQSGGRVFLLGSKPGHAELAAGDLQRRHPGLVICGTHDGYFKEDAPVVEQVRQARPDLVVVGLGAPKQELWMVQHGPDTGAKLMVGLGGALDVFAGKVDRAPAGWQRLGLEWLYRLLHDPKRIKRMIKLPLILWYALIARIRGR